MLRNCTMATLLVSSCLAATAASAATTKLAGPDGAVMGSVSLTETPNGVLLSADLKNIPPGVHGIHIHATGACTPDFGAAGGHFAGGASAHGYMVEGGPHAGDLPNIHVPDTGSLTVEIFDPKVSLGGGEGGLFDDDGSAIIIHSGADDYESQPSGNSGDRIACGVIEK